MCGFVGYVAWDDRHRITRESLETMSARIAHRGPDGQGTYFSSPHALSRLLPQVALAHRRLAILDPDPRANQPFADAAARQLVFNGEIYNFRELRAELSSLQPDYAWRTTGDTETLLLAYDQWGDDCVEHLNGMFAFAVWDPRRQSLYLARDRMGQKPLYISMLQEGGTCWRDGGEQFLPGAAAGSIAPPLRVAFASELSALRVLDGFDASVDSNALTTYLMLGYIPHATIYNGAVKLPAGTWMRINADGAIVRRYYKPYRVPVGSGLSDAEAIDSTRSLLAQAVRRQLVSDVPLGCFLSGGVDSSIVAALMKASAEPGQPVMTFSMGFHDPLYDESEYAQAVARHLGTQHQQFTVTPDAAIDLPKLAEVYGEPFGDSSALPTHYLARATREHVKVALSGDGGDELFGGYDRYRAIALSQRLETLPFIAAAEHLAQHLPGWHPKSRLTRFKRLMAAMHLPAAQRYAAFMHIFSTKQTADLLGCDPAAVQSRDLIAAAFAANPGGADVVVNALAVDRETYLPEDLLTKVDRASMLHALEVRSPYMDHELVDFASGLSRHQLLAGGPKRMLRQAFARDLPAWVFKRKKMGFAVPIGQWFGATLRPMLHDALLAKNGFASTHLNMDQVRKLIEEHESGATDHSQRLYALLMLELWWNTQCDS